MMRLTKILTLLPLCLTACLPFASNSNETQSEDGTITPQAEALESITGDFDGDGNIERATLYHTPAYTIAGDSLTPDEHIAESYAIRFDKESIATKESSRRLSHLTLLGDIDLDGKDELGVFTHNSTKEQSWGDYSAYSNNANEWQSIASTTLNISLLESLGKNIAIDKLITADSTRRGYVTIKHITILDGESCETTTESVQLI